MKHQLVEAGAGYMQFCTYDIVSNFKKKQIEQGVVAQTDKPNSSEAETGGSPKLEVQPSGHSKFQATQGYRETMSLNQPTNQSSRASSYKCQLTDASKLCMSVFQTKLKPTVRCSNKIIY